VEVRVAAGSDPVTKAAIDGQPGLPETLDGLVHPARGTRPYRRCGGRSSRPMSWFGA